MLNGNKELQCSAHSKDPVYKNLLDGNRVTCHHTRVSIAFGVVQCG